MMTIYGVYAPVDDPDFGEDEQLVELFATEALAEQYVADFPRLSREVSADGDGWLVRFWQANLDQTIAVYGKAAAGDIGPIPAYVRRGFPAGPARVAAYRERTIEDAKGRIEHARRTAAAAKGNATRAANTDLATWTKWHFPKGPGLTIKPIEVHDAPLAFEALRESEHSEFFLRGHNEG